MPPIITETPKSAISSASSFLHPICTVRGVTNQELAIKPLKVIPAIERLLLLQEQGTIGHLPFRADFYDRLIVRSCEAGYSVRLLDEEHRLSDLVVEGDDLWRCVDLFLFENYSSGQVAA